MDYRRQRQQRQPQEEQTYPDDGDRTFNGNYNGSYNGKSQGYDPRVQQQQAYLGYSAQYQQQQQQYTEYYARNAAQQTYRYPETNGGNNHYDDESEYDETDSRSTAVGSIPYDPFAVKAAMRPPPSALHRRTSSPTKSYTDSYKEENYADRDWGKDGRLIKNESINSAVLRTGPRTREQRLGLPEKKSVGALLGTIICAVVVLLVLTALGVLGYLYFPRFPVIHVNSIDLQNLQNGAFNFSIPDGSGNLNHLQIQLSMKMEISTYNPNSYGLQVDVIDLT
ncbi:UNVERIFIED_CONTAM: hypothetical protein HDU68_003313, partial [Siphonaria sp. JEL0065]